MSRKIIGVTVGTTQNPKKVAENVDVEIKNVKGLPEVLSKAAYIDAEDDENVEDTENPSFTVDSELSEESKNPVQNKVVAKAFKEKLSLPKTNDSVEYGTEGQFAVSDGKGGVSWVTIPLAKGENF